MPSGTLSSNHAARLTALRATGLLDSPIEPAFDRLTKLITIALEVPVSLVSLVDEDRQFFKSQCGLPEPWATNRQTPLSHSFCRIVADTGESLIVADARENPLVRDNLAIRDLGVIAYAGVPILDGDGFVLGSLCAIDTQPHEWSDRDIEILNAISRQLTEDIRHRAHSMELAKELRLQLEIEERLRSASRFNVHDLRTPLAALVTGMEVVRLMGPLTEQQDEYLSICQQNGKTLIGLVNNLLDIGNVEHRGGESLQRKTCKPSELIATALTQVNSLANEKRIAISSNSEAAPEIDADFDKLLRTLVNLLGNAIKFTNAGGAVVVSAVSIDDKARPAVVFSVKDTGIGMDDAENIFNEGVRLDREAETHRSTGMGLTFCKRIVEAHGGHIWFESKPGVGSTFYFDVPLVTHSKTSAV